jgi:hypothetical protein
MSSTIEHRNPIFSVTRDHLKLLKSSVVAWSSQWDGTMFGAACVDPRRPYGDRDVYRSMLRILGWKMNRVADLRTAEFRDWDIETDEIPIDEMNRLDQLHQETEIALRICLSRGEFETGIFRWPEPGGEWVKFEGTKTTLPSP